MKSDNQRFVKFRKFLYPALKVYFIENMGNKHILLITIPLIILVAVLGIYISTNNSSSDDTPETQMVESDPALSIFASSSHISRRSDDSFSCGDSSEIIQNKRSIVFSENDNVSVVITPENTPSVQESDLEYFNSVLDTGELSTESHSPIRSQMFNPDCLEFESTPLLELTDQYEYPNADNYRIFLSSEGQGLNPNLTVVVFAKKDDYLINSTKPLRNGSEAAEFARSFFAGPCGQAADPIACALVELQTPEELDLIEAKTEELLADFELI